VHVRGELLRDPDTGAVRRVGSVMDITEELLAEQRLREQADLLDKAQDAIIVRDLDHRITYWNKSAERLYGWTAAEAVGRPADQLLHQGVRSFSDAIRHVLEHGEWTSEMAKKTRDGRNIVVQSRWTLVRDAAGRPKSVLVIDTDVTERRKLESQFLRSQRMESIGTLAGGIAHDLNNVLAPILMSVALLREKFTDEESASILDMLQQSAQRGASMVRQVLTFARGVEGQRVPVQPRDLLADIEKICRDTFAKNLVIRLEVAPDTRPVLGDPTQLHQVLLNLCVNARDAMPLGGVLTLGVENLAPEPRAAALPAEAGPGPYVRIRVSDTGDGIPAEIHERVFEPFFTTKEVGQGTGLGLSTVLAIVKSHGGLVQFQSEPGRGTTFEILLPTTGEGAAAPEEPPLELPRGHGELILVVDDEASVRNLTGQTLEAFGYRVIKAVDGAEAVSLFVQRRQEIALVLTDMLMPVMDGPATVHALLRLEPRLKIIAASGLGADANATKVLSMGVKHFLPKPSSAEMLLTTIRQVLDGRSSGTGLKLAGARPTAASG
jgi:PAS domain S-box-containing protein